MNSIPLSHKSFYLNKRRFFSGILAVISLTISGCSTTPPYNQKPHTQDESQASRPIIKHHKTPGVRAPSFSFAKRAWEDLPGWMEDDLAQAWPAFLRSCDVLYKKRTWGKICEKSKRLGNPTVASVRAFFHIHFTPHQIATSEKNNKGLVTGYYEPQIYGSRFRTKSYKYPILGIPDELTAKKMSVSPEYFPRQEIEKNFASMEIPVLFWVADKIDLFFLQIQGSGRVSLPNGEIVKIGFGMSNGLPYTSIGKVLVEQGEIKLHEASMEGIKKWANANPNKLDNLLHKNERYIFFKNLKNLDEGPIGAMNVPLTPERSLAVDPQIIPLGFPVYLATTWPNSNKPLNRLVLAQDTGSAIKGPLRGDFFWGFGPQAGYQAGKMKQIARMWVLLPNIRSIDSP